jgi:hypothetical protein
LVRHTVHRAWCLLNLEFYGIGFLNRSRYGYGSVRFQTPRLYALRTTCLPYRPKTATDADIINKPSASYLRGNPLVVPVSSVPPSPSPSPPPWPACRLRPTDSSAVAAPASHAHRPSQAHAPPGMCSPRGTRAPIHPSSALADCGAEKGRGSPEYSASAFAAPRLAAGALGGIADIAARAAASVACMESPALPAAPAGRTRFRNAGVNAGAGAGGGVEAAGRLFGRCCALARALAPAPPPPSAVRTGASSSRAACAAGNADALPTGGPCGVPMASWTGTGGSSEACTSPNGAAGPGGGAGTGNLAGGESSPCSGGGATRTASVQVAATQCRS